MSIEIVIDGGERGLKGVKQIDAVEDEPADPRVDRRLDIARHISDQDRPILIDEMLPACVEYQLRFGLATLTFDGVLFNCAPRVVRAVEEIVDVSIVLGKLDIDPSMQIYNVGFGIITSSNAALVGNNDGQVAMSVAEFDGVDGAVDPLKAIEI